MKKLYVLIALTFSLYVQNVVAQAPQCTYDYTWLALGKNGIWPDSATNFMSGTVGQPYLQNVTIKVPYDTTTSTLGTVVFDRIELKTNISNPPNYGLPPGLSLAGTPSNLKFPGNDTSCIVIYGTPTTPGTYNLSFTLWTYVVGIIIPVNTQTITYYKIIINPAGTGIKDQSLKPEVLQNAPNPFTGKTRITFNAPYSGKAVLHVYNMIGKKIKETSMTAGQGINEISFDGSSLPGGIYLYSVEVDGIQSATKRMIISHD